MARGFSAPMGYLGERTVLAGVYAARLAVAYALALAATVVRTTDAAEPTSTPLVLLIILIPTAFTLASWLYGGTRRIGARFLAAQVTHDVALTTTAVLLTGGVGSEFGLFYVLLISAAGLLLGFRGAIAAAVTCIAVYSLIAYLQISPQLAVESETVVLPNVSGRVTTILWSLSLTLVVFVLVGVAAGMVGRRVRVQRERLMELEHQIAESPIDAQMLLNTIESGVLSINDREELDFVNVTARSILGSPTAAAGSAAENPGIAAVYGLLVDSMRSEREVEYTEVDFPSAKGDATRFGVTTTLLYDPSGRKRGAVAIVKDVEGARRLEELARQADRLKAVNELSAGLAHEIQNPLAAIRSAVELIGATVESRNPEESRLVDLTIRETDRLTDLIDDFKTFSGMKIRKLERVDLSAVVDDAMDVDRISHGRGGPRMIFVRPGAPHVVEGDHNLLKQVCLNLLNNARAAVNGVDDAEIEVRVSGESSVPGLEGAGSFVTLEVRDNGIGIDEELRDRIFDPFVTTRTDGFGMGLAIVHRIVDLHGGVVWVDSKVGRGARFRIAIPRAR